MGNHRATDPSMQCFPYLYFVGLRENRDEIKSRQVRLLDNLLLSEIKLKPCARNRMALQYMIL